MIKIPYFEKSYLYKAIENSPHISSHNAAQNDPITILIANEIAKCSAKELEEIKDHRGRGDIFRLIINKRNYFLFALLLEKGAFKEKLFECSAFFLEQSHNVTIEQYRSLLNVETNEKNKMGDYFFIIIEDLCKDNIDLELFEKIITTYKEKYFGSINKYLLRGYSNNIYKTTAMRVLHENDIYPEINDLVMTKNKNTFDSIPSYQINEIRHALDLGYLINENNIEDKTILTMLLETKNGNLVELLLPHLKVMIPIDRSLEEQTKLLENFKQWPNYEQIEKMYTYLLLNAQLDEKVKKNNRKL